MEQSEIKTLIEKCLEQLYDGNRQDRDNYDEVTVTSGMAMQRRRRRQLHHQPAKDYLLAYIHVYGISPLENYMSPVQQSELVEHDYGCASIANLCLGVYRKNYPLTADVSTVQRTLSGDIFLDRLDFFQKSAASWQSEHAHGPNIVHVTGRTWPTNGSSKRGGGVDSFISYPDLALLSCTST